MGEGRAVFLLHGGGLDSRTYKRNIELLSRGHKVIAPDISFFGRSHPPDACWDFKDYAALFSQFVDDLNLNDIILIGHSFGGGIALELSTVNSKISKLVLVNSAGILPSYSKSKFFWLVFYKSVLNLLYCNKFVALKIIVHFIQNIFWNLFSTPKKLNTVLKSIYTKFDGFEKIQIPTLIVWGEKDIVFPLEYASIFKNQISDSDIKYVDGGHDWLLLDPDTFSDLIKSI